MEFHEYETLLNAMFLSVSNASRHCQHSLDAKIAVNVDYRLWSPS
jgi:hypothetical protein